MKHQTSTLSGALLDAATTDRELLEKAAKAAGYKLHAGLMEQRAISNPEAVALALSDPGNTWWDALASSGDALDLFSRMPFCELYVSEIGCTVFLPRKPPGQGPNLKCDEYASEHGGDLQAAIRRAIVRAAAALAE